MKKVILLLLLLLFAIGGSWLVNAANESVTALKFSHSLHKETASMTCVQCHSEATEVKPGIRKNPGHNQCIECHDVTSKSECGMCHTDAIKGGGFGKPFNHTTPDWANRVHGMDANVNVVECRVCHEQSSCDQCHSNATRKLSPHGPNYLFNHATDAAMGGRCLSCHETRESCTSCHRATIPLRHPLGFSWANLEKGGNHAEEGRMYFESCLACHDQGANEPTCARCHN